MDVEGLERATVAGVAPAATAEIGGWLVAFDNGTISRAKSAVPLSHDLGPDALDAIETAYAARTLPPAFRVAEAPGLAAVREALAARGYAGVQTTVVKVGDPARLAAFHAQPADLLAAPDDGWASVYVSDGFDPVDGANRVAALSRSPDAVYGAVREHGRTVAVGAATFGHGWAGIHGMRTAQDCRGLGYASQVLTALGRAMTARGVHGVFLQVEDSNPARSLYRKAGFAEAWRYRYWSKSKLY